MNALAGTYAVLVALWLLMRRLTGDRPWWLQVVNELAPVLLAPSIPVLLTSLSRRSSFAAGALQPSPDSEMRRPETLYVEAVA